MKTQVIGAAIGLAALAAVIAAGPVLEASEEGGSGETVRIGVYNSRCVALAYGNSEQHNERIRELRQRREKALEEGKEQIAKECERTGEALQRRAHMQVFSNGPIDGIVAEIADEMPALAAKHDLDAIAEGLVHAGPGVETVDITKDVMELFDPPERVWKWMEGVLEHAPIPIEEAAMLDVKL
jgi:hypothetical protein